MKWKTNLSRTVQDVSSQNVRTYFGRDASLSDTRTVWVGKFKLNSTTPQSGQLHSHWLVLCDVSHVSHVIGYALYPS